MDERLREELLAMATEDSSVRAVLAADGSLFEGYNPRMQAIHDRNAARLAEMINKNGWPGVSLAGEDGEEAAWIIAQHAIAQPAFQRRCLALLEAAVESGEAPKWQAAYLTDRIRFNERKAQVYGTQFDWDEGGVMSPWLIEDAGHVEERRLAAGLEPLAEVVAKMRQGLRAEKPPTDYAARQREIEEWARSVGWLE